VGDVHIKVSCVDGEVRERLVALLMDLAEEMRARGRLDDAELLEMNAFVVENADQCGLDGD